jgi:CRISPR/Cas system-associated protein Csm6
MIQKIFLSKRKTMTSEFSVEVLERLLKRILRTKNTIQKEKHLLLIETE